MGVPEVVESLLVLHLSSVEHQLLELLILDDERLGVIPIAGLCQVLCEECQDPLLLVGGE